MLAADPDLVTNTHSLFPNGMFVDNEGRASDPICSNKTFLVKITGVYAFEMRFPSVTKHQALFVDVKSSELVEEHGDNPGPAKVSQL